MKKEPELAVCGTHPTFSEPLHVGRPNVGDETEFLRLTQELLQRRWLTNNGPLVQELERKIAHLHGVKHCVAMSNGTVALEIAIRALGLEGEVIVPSYTFVATAHALYWQGITPVFADIDPTTHNLDPNAVRRMITPRTTGLIGVHLWGRPAPVLALQQIADEHGLNLMYDSAHAFASSVGGTRIGGFGRCEVLSFHATKVYNTFEGGAVLTNEDELAETMRLMRNFGFAGFDNVIHPGTNGKMPEINAAMGLVNLAALDRFIATNQRNYEMYLHLLSTADGIQILKHDPANNPNYQYMVIEVDARIRDQVVAGLHAENILARKYFWPGCHRMKPYHDLFPHAGLLLPATQNIAGRVIVLPTGTAVNATDIAKIADILSILVRRYTVI